MWLDLHDTSDIYNLKLYCMPCNLPSDPVKRMRKYLQNCMHSPGVTLIPAWALDTQPLAWSCPTSSAASLSAHSCMQLTPGVIKLQTKLEIEGCTKRNMARSIFQKQCMCMQELHCRYRVSTNSILNRQSPDRGLCFCATCKSKVCGIHVRHLRWNRGSSVCHSWYNACTVTHCWWSHTPCSS